MFESWLISISVLIIALAFVALVIYLILALQALRCSLKKTDEALEEANALVRSANGLISDVKEKIDVLDPLFNRCENLLSSVDKPSGIKEFAQEVTSSVEDEKRKTIQGYISTGVEVAEWALIGVTLWQRIKNKILK